MKTMTIDGGKYVRMIGAGAARLYDNRKAVNDLNVFPIPDGDTGDNMYMTISAGRDSASAGGSLGECANSVSKGMLLGARGNSGVILSRIFAGIAKGLDGRETASLSEFKSAMQCGVEESYNAVSNPVEGTILTVFKDSVNAAASCSGSFEEYFDALCTESEKSLERTPSLLDVLARAGVVDSGGAGLVHILSGMSCALDPDADLANRGPVESKQTSVDLSAFGEDTELEFGYCTEFLLRLQNSKVDTENFDEKVIVEYLNSVGESVVAFRDGTIVKVHVHTKTPGAILSHCQRWGEFLTIKIENMTLQHHETHKAAPKRPHKKAAVVAVASGEGLEQLFSDMGADIVIRGGQTMNPSASDFVSAFEELNADTIYVLPNNSNIILTARQAAGICADAHVCVLPSKSIGEGYSLLGSIDFASGDDAQIEAEAAEVLGSVVSGMVSRAIRTTEAAAEGDFIGFVKDDILCASPERVEALCGLCGKLGAGSCDVLLLIVGSDVPSQEAQTAASKLQGLYPGTEVAVYQGGQPVFDYIIVIQ